MRMGARVSYFRSAAAAALGFCVAFSAHAQAPAPSVDPKMLDVAGVRLGMTADEAIAALKKFDGDYKIAKLYLDEPMPNSYAVQGHEAFPPNPNAPEHAEYFDQISAAKGEAQTQCDQILRCNQEFHEDIERINIWFSPMPGSERVILIVRTKEIHLKPPPNVAVLKDGLFSKYPKDQISRTETQGVQSSYDWLFDKSGRLYSPASLKSKGIPSIQGGIPSTVKPGDGVGLSVMVAVDYNNKDLADHISICLFDGDALFKSAAQSKATYDALTAQIKARELQKAAQSQSKTKF